VKTYVLDASALFAFLQNKSGAQKVNGLKKVAVQEPENSLMSAVK